MPPIALRYLRASFFFLIWGILIGLHLSAALHLGHGGYGMVFLARDPLIGRYVALKLPRPEALITPELRHKGEVHEFAIFADKATFEAFRAHDYHKLVVAFARKISDWTQVTKEIP